MIKQRIIYIAGFLVILCTLTISLLAIQKIDINASANSIQNIRSIRGNSSEQNFNRLVLIGTESNGLFVSFDGGNNYKKISHPLLIDNNGKNISIQKVYPLGIGEFILVTKGKGLLYTKNGGHDFKPLNNGLPKKRIIVNGEMAQNIYRDITGITADTNNTNNLFLTTKYGIYRSYNRGKKWVYYSRPPRYYNNLTAIAFSSKYGFHLYLGTAYNGLFMQEEASGKWYRMNYGLKMTGSIVEEIGSLAIDPRDNRIVYCGHNFGNRLYKLSLKRIKYKKDQNGQIISYSSRNRKWMKVKLPFRKKIGTVEVLNDIKNLQFHYSNNKRILAFISNKGAVASSTDGKSWFKIRINKFLNGFSQANDVNTLTIFGNGKLQYSFNYVHLLTSRWKYAVKSKYYSVAKKRRGFYIQTHVAFQKKRLKRLIKYLKKCNYNMVTIDLKDDFGHVNYRTNLDIVRKTGANDDGTKIRLKRFLKAMHENGIYVVARLVVFKDPTLYKYLNGKYALYNKKLKKPWKGYIISRRSKRKISIKERWMDPFSQFVWKYNVAIAKELEQFGVDEIQFDYIRFPTDGKNLKNAKYRYRQKGQQKKDAIESFLMLARSKLNIPISVDIYGANGWYHMGDRIGQDIEMLAEHVDVICPMFYPSHFEVSFLNHSPYKERPYRIYYYGTRRSLSMASYRVDIRSYLQAFRLRANRYDRNYYGTEYVAHQILGCVDAGSNVGFTFWNSATRYKIVPRAVRRTRTLKTGIRRRRHRISYR